MDSNAEKNHSLRIYMWVVVVVGLAAFLLALNGMTNAPVSVSYLLLLCFTILLGSRATVEIEQFKTNITVTDVIIFLTMFLYDGEAAVVLATTEAFFTSFRYTKTLRFQAFNAATMACSISVTIWLLRYLFGPLETLLSFRSSPKILLVICVMVVSHYIANASLISAATAMRQKKPFFQTWKEYYLWM